MFGAIRGFLSWAMRRGATESVEAGAKKGLLETAKDVSIVGAVGTTAVVGGTSALVGPDNNPFQSLISNVMATGQTAAAESGVQAGFQGFFKWIEELADMLMRTFGEGPFSTGLKNWALVNQGDSPIQPANPSALNPVHPGTVVTAENEITAHNLTVGISEIAEIDLGHKAHVIGHGLAEGGVHVVNLLGHGADLADWASGSVLGWAGIDTGHEDRNISAALHKGLMDNVVDPLIGAPEMKTAWDRVLHGGAEIVPSFLTGNFLGATTAGIAVGTSTTAARLGTAANTVARHSPMLSATEGALSKFELGSP